MFNKLEKYERPSAKVTKTFIIIIFINCIFFLSIVLFRLCTVYNDGEKKLKKKLGTRKKQINAIEYTEL